MSCVKFQHLCIPQGTDWSWTFKYVDSAGDAIDLTNYTAECHFRSTQDAASTLYEASTANGKMSINAAAGEVNLLLNNTDSSAFTFTDAVYDVEITNTVTGDITRLAQGTIYLDGEVTR